MSSVPVKTVNKRKPLFTGLFHRKKPENTGYSQGYPLIHTAYYCYCYNFSIFHYQ